MLQGESYVAPSFMTHEGDQARTISPVPRADRARVLLIEDHPVFGEGLRALCEREGAFEWVGQAQTSTMALAMARRHNPAIILLDVWLADANGLDLIIQLRHACAGAKIVVLTGHHKPEYLMYALRLGVDAYLHKDMSAAATLDALHQVLNGERVIGQPQALTEVLNEFGQLLREHERARSGLTDQEIEILRQAAAGLNNKDIGARQFLSEITIKRKMQDIYHKLDVKSRAQAVAEAMRVGFI